MKRIYELLLSEHLKNENQMLFLAGPRQVGKTTIAKHLQASHQNFHYFNWDNLDHRQLIMKGQTAVGDIACPKKVQAELPIIVFDEIHKYHLWKTFIKGFFDEFKDLCRIIVTGSSKLDVYRKGGDSMMGRYFLYHIFPLTIGELTLRANVDKVIYPQTEIPKNQFESLWANGGFPDPFLKDSKTFTNKWKQMRNTQLFKEDVRDLSNIQEIGQLEMLAAFITSQVGQLVNRLELAKKIQVSASSVGRWLNTLQNFFYCFEVRPWRKNITRSLIKEPKIYLYDWSLVDDIGARAENFVATHLHKFVQFNNDYGRGHYQLCYLRDKEKREVDFLIVHDNKPWFLVEVKHSQNAGLSKNLYHFQEQTQAKHAFQVAFDLPYVNKNCFEYKKPIIVPASSLLSQLV